MLLRELYEEQEKTISIKDAISMAEASPKDIENAIAKVKQGNHYKRVLQACKVWEDPKSYAVMTFVYKGNDSLSNESLFFRIAKDGKVQHAYGGKQWNTSSNQQDKISASIVAELDPIKIYESIYNNALEEILRKCKTQVDWKREKTQNKDPDVKPNTQSRLMMKRMLSPK